MFCSLSFDFKSVVLLQYSDYFLEICYFHSENFYFLTHNLIHLQVFALVLLCMHQSYLGNLFRSKLRFPQGKPPLPKATRYNVFCNNYFYAKFHSNNFFINQLLILVSSNCGHIISSTNSHN